MAHNVPRGHAVARPDNHARVMTTIDAINPAKGRAMERALFRNAKPCITSA
jgi:hypothetical protein